MHTIILGLGRCGQRMSIAIPKEILYDPTFPGMMFSKLLLQKQRIRAITLADISDQSLLSKKELLSIEKRSRINIHTVRLRETGGGGVGGKWWESEKIARSEGAKKVITLLSRKGYLQVIDTIFIIHSAGGGTGSGSGPVIAEKILDYFKETEGEINRVFMASVLALPHEDDPMRRLNALSTIGRYNGLADTIILFDNKKRMLIKEILGKRFSEEDIHSDVEFINKIFARIFYWLNSTDGAISGIQRGIRHIVEPKDYEASDFKSILRANNQTSLSVPFYAEYDQRELYKYKVTYLVLYTLIQNHLVSVNLGHEHVMDNLLLILGIPISIRKIVEENNPEIISLEKIIKKYIKVKGRIEVIRVYYTRGNKIVVAGIMVNPYIERIRELLEYSENDLKNFDQESRTYYEEALELFKEFYKSIYTEEKYYL